MPPLLDLTSVRTLRGTIYIEWPRRASPRYRRKESKERRARAPPAQGSRPGAPRGRVYSRARPCTPVIWSRRGVDVESIHHAARARPYLPPRISPFIITLSPALSFSPPLLAPFLLLFALPPPDAASSSIFSLFSGYMARCASSLPAAPVQIDFRLRRSSDLRIIAPANEIAMERD